MTIAPHDRVSMAFRTMNTLITWMKTTFGSRIRVSVFVDRKDPHQVLESTATEGESVLQQDAQDSEPDPTWEERAEDSDEYTAESGGNGQNIQHKDMKLKIRGSAAARESIPIVQHILKKYPQLKILHAMMVKDRQVPAHHPIWIFMGKEEEWLEETGYVVYMVTIPNQQQN